MVALIVQQREASQCKWITPTVGTTSKEMPQNSKPQPYIADTIAAFAPGMFLIYGFSLSRRGMEVLMRVKGPPKMSPQVSTRMTTDVSEGYRWTYYKKTKRMAEARREAIKMILLKLGLKQDPSNPPKKVEMAQRTAMMRDSLFIPIMERQKMSHVTTTAFTDFTKRKLRIYPGTLGNFHTVMKFTDACVLCLLCSFILLLLKGGSPSSTRWSGMFSTGDSGGKFSTISS